MLKNDRGPEESRTGGSHGRFQPTSRLFKGQFSKVAASEEPRAYPLGYVEGLNDARMPRADFFNRLIERHGRPCTKVGGRPCVALMTPDRLYNRLGPVKTETRAKARYRTIDRGITKSSQALVFLVPASSSPSCDQASILLVYGAVTAQPVENRLTRPIRSPPSRRRACVARWSQVIHRYPPFLESWRGNLLTTAYTIQSP